MEVKRGRPYNTRNTVNKTITIDKELYEMIIETFPDMSLSKFVTLQLIKKLKEEK